MGITVNVLILDLFPANFFSKVQSHRYMSESG